MRTVVFILLIILVNGCTTAQNNLEGLINPAEINRTSFVGKVDNIPIYQNSETGDLYKLIENPNKISETYYYKLYKKGERGFKESNISKSTQYIFDDYIVSL